MCTAVSPFRLARYLQPYSPHTAPRGARGLRLAAAASNDKPLKSLVENEDTRSTVAIGASMLVGAYTRTFPNILHTVLLSTKQSLA